MAKNNPTPKNAKAAQARSQAQAQVRAQERKTAVLISIGVAVAVVIFGGIVWWIVQSSQVPSLGSGDAVAPAGADETGGIVVGMNGVVGEDVPSGAPRLDLYEDFMCPICGQFEQINSEDIDAMMRAGDVELYFHPVSILDRVSEGTNYSTRAANAAATVADGAPAQFLDFVHALYADQPQEYTPGLSNQEMTDMAISVGVPEDVANSFDDGKFTKWVIAATDQASQDGMAGTPTVMVNREVLNQQLVPYFQPGALRTHIEGL